MIKKIGENRYNITFKGVIYCDDLLATSDKFSMIKCKCQKCSLHFILFTWYPDKHNANNITCPECKCDNGRFDVWKEKVFRQIFEHVPGNAK